MADRARLSVLLLALAVCHGAGCDSAERAALDQARGEAMERTVAAPTGWVADASLAFPLADLQTLALALLDDVLQRVPEIAAPLGGRAVSVQPHLRADSLTLAAAPDLPDCLRAHGHLSGTIGAQLGGRSLGVPVSVELTAPLCLVVIEGRTVLVRLGELESVEVSVMALRPAKRGAAVETFLRGALRERPPSAGLATMGDNGLPIVAARLAEVSDTVRIDLRTDVPGEGEALPRPVIGRSVALTMSDRSFTALLRRAIWTRQGSSPTPFLDPVDVDLGTNRFTARVRLWNPGWPATWQDYTFAGPLTVDGDRIRVKVATVEPGAAAGWLRANRLLTSRVQDALTDALEGRISASLPGDLDRAIRTVHLGVKLQGITDEAAGFTLAAKVDTTVGP